MNKINLFLIAFLASNFSIHAATFTVTTTNHSDAGSLRQAMLDANANPGPDQIAFNIVSAGKTIIPTNALPAITEAVTIDGTTQPGYSNAPIVEINGQFAGTGTDGLRLWSGGTVIRGLVINRFNGDGIEIATNGNNVIENCFIGLSVSGTTDQGNNVSGIYITNAPNNRIGGTNVAQRNVISGNQQNGVLIQGLGASANNVLGNFIGLNATGGVAIANSVNGIFLNGAPANVVGGTAGNVISGNSQSGIRLEGTNANSNLIAGNTIGLNPTGLVDLGNGQQGVYLLNAPTNTVGGTTVGARNVISGNNQAGVRFDSASARGNRILGNFIGTDASGQLARGNSAEGVGSANNASFNSIGGVIAGEANLIAFNSGDGVFLPSGTNNVVRGNAIHSNNGLGIDLGADGRLNNDAGDPDTGANLQQNYPVLLTATNTSAGLLLSGTLNSRPGASYLLDFYSNLLPDFSTNGEGQVYLGSTNVTTGADSNAVFAVTLPPAVGRWISATATDTNGNTSEFSTSVRAESTVAAQTFTVVNTNDSGPGSLRQALTQVNNTPAVASHLVRFAIPGSGTRTITPLSDLPGIIEPVIIDGFSQAGSSSNTLATGNNAVWLIRLDGNNSGAVSDGLRLLSSSNVVRGLIITRFLGNGIELAISSSSTSAGNVIVGNCIGLDENGADQGNGANGVFAADSPGNRIGGAAAGDRNVISGNGGQGVEMNGPGAFQNRVLGNYIGSDPGGTLDRRNGAGGVFISGAAHNIIGGAAAGEGNLLVYNQGDGVEINGLNATNNLVLGNFIGTDAGGASLGNVVAGVFITGNARFNVIGATNSGAGNRIAYNFSDGIYVQNGTNNAIRGNTIWSQGVMGIDLGNNGVTANDAGDSDTGANQLQNFPVITSATINPASTVIAGTLNSRPNGNYTLDFFANLVCDDSGNGEGQQYLGSANVATDGSGNAALNVTFPVTAIGRFLAATATDTNGNSSEFSACFSAASTLPPMTFTVVNTNDAGAGSLRQALLDADSFPSGSPNIIAFNIPGAGPHTIAPLSQLPTNREPVFIDGYSQPGANTNSLADGFNGTVRIRIDGARMVAFGTAGLRLQSGGNIVRGIAFTTWGNRNAIEISRGGSNVIAGCLIGIDPDGSDKHAGIGVLITDSVGNRVGGLSAGDRNVISYNFSHAIHILGQVASNNVVQGNFIGTDFTGTIKRANAIDGVRIDDGSYNLIGGTAAGARNLISGNSTGVAITSPTPGAARGNVVQGNLIGTDITGAIALGNNSGISAGGTGTIIGGVSASARNIIGGSGQFGIDLATGPGGAVVLGNWIGIGNGGNPLTNGAQGINVSSSSNRIGGTLAGEGNVIAYSRNHGVVVTEFSVNVGNAIRGNSIYANHSTFQPALGIDLGFNGVTANDVGDDDTGANNRQNFPVITSASGTASSTTIAGTLNSIASQAFQLDFFANTTCDPSGNGEGQFYLGSASINTDGSGNGSFNVTLPVGAPGRFITATATDAQGNSSEFSACFEASVGIAPMTFTVVNTNDSGAGSLRQAILDSNGHVSSQNNTIAFNVPGSGIRAIKLLTPLPLFTQPVTIDGFTQPGASANTLPSGNNASWLIELRGVGATFNEETLRLNVAGLVVRGLRLTASAGLGIEIVTSNCVVAGCFISSNAAGGILINSVHGHRIGGTVPADRNVISGHNGGRAVEINGGNNNLVLGNLIGPAPDGTNALTTTQFEGVSIFGGSGNVIGDGTAAGGNVIAFHQSDAVVIQSGTNNTVRGNRIFSNSFAIDLGSDNVTANDVGDGDIGPNHLQNFPIITNAVANAGNTLIQGRLNSRANTTFTLEFFANTTCHFSGNGEGEFFLGNASVTTDGSGNATFNVLLPITADGDFATATATDPAGNTSEFSPCQTFVINRPGQTFTVVNTNDSGPGSLRQALLDCRVTRNSTPDQIVFNIPGTGVRLISPLTALPVPKDAVVIDGFTQAGSSANTLTNGNNAVLLIRLDGINLGFGFDGLTLTNGGNVVRGLEVVRFGGSGIGLNAGSSNVVSGCLVWSNEVGVASSGGSRNRIGGPTPGDRNVLSGNDAYGVLLQANGNSVVQGNFIGTDLAGTSAMANNIGVFVNGGSSNLIGPSSSGASLFFGSPAVVRNVISGNESAGISLVNIAGTPTGHRVFGNLIGTDVTGTFGLGGQFAGINLGGAVGTVIGGPNEHEPNLIAFNAGSGVQAPGAGTTNNSIRMNTFFENAGLAIDLDLTGVATNDPGDGDSGGNHLQNFPVLTNVLFTGSNLVVQGTLNSRPSTTYHLDFYANAECDPLGHGEGKQWLGSTTIVTGADGNATFSVNFPLPSEGYLITATATDPAGNTSEFCACRETVSIVPPVTYTVTNENDSGPGSLRKAIEDNNATFHSGPNRIDFNIPGAGVKTIAPLTGLPEITRPASIDGFTQPGASPATNGNNPVWLIQIDGSNTGTNDVDGLHFVNSSSNVVRGLCVINFFDDGIQIDGGVGSIVEENLVGIDVLDLAPGAAGLKAAGGAGMSYINEDAFRLERSGFNTVRMNYGGNARNGINLSGLGCVNNSIFDNVFGMDPDGNPAPLTLHGIRPNNAFGTVISGGGVYYTGGNVVSSPQFNLTTTVDIPSFGWIGGNMLHDRGGNGFGTTTLTTPAPQLISAVTNNPTTVQGGLLGAPSQLYTLIFYARLATGTYSNVLTTNVTTAPNGLVNFTIVMPALPVGTLLRATAEGPGGTSEDWPDIVVMPPGPYGNSDLCIAKSDSTDPVIVGTNFTYTITVTNGGPLTATNVIVRDFLPTFLFVTPIPPPTTTHGVFFGGNPLSVYIPVLTNREVATITFTATSFVFTNIYTNVVTVTSAMTDPNSANNSDSETTTIVPFSQQPRLTIALENDQVVVRWTGNYILQRAPTVPFMPGIDIPAATSPYYPTQAVQQFFRLRSP